MSVAVHVFGQVRMFRDLRPALMHLAIFYGFLAITVISANYFSLGLVQAVLSWPLDGLAWLSANGFRIDVATRRLSGESEAAMRQGFVRLFAEHRIPIDAQDPTTRLHSVWP